MSRRSALLLTLGIGLPLAAAILWLVSTSRAMSETPEYPVIRVDGKFEIRDYPAMTVATTVMARDGMNAGFGRLARFITGGNSRSERIAMTAPVLIDAQDGDRAMSFIMPKTAVESGVPSPSSDAVKLGDVAAGRFAVLRFGGGRTEENENAAVEKLRTWLAAQKIERAGEPFFAYYDPPWTPLVLRRNEVVVRIARDAR